MVAPVAVEPLSVGIPPVSQACTAGGFRSDCGISQKGLAYLGGRIESGGNVICRGFHVPAVDRFLLVSGNEVVRERAAISCGGIAADGSVVAHSDDQIVNVGNRLCDQSDVCVSHSRIGYGDFCGGLGLARKVR